MYSERLCYEIGKEGEILGKRDLRIGRRKKTVVFSVRISLSELLFKKRRNIIRV